MSINRRGSITVGLLLLAFLMVSGYFAYIKMLKPEQIKKGLVATEKEAVKVFDEFTKSKNVNFKVVAPKYIPNEFYLNPAMGPSDEGNKFQFLYNNPTMTRIDITEKNMTDAEKAKYLENQKKFPYKTVTLKDGTVAVKFGGETVKGKTEIPGTNQVVELSLGMLEYRFFIGNIHITVANSVMFGGELIDGEELFKMANSMVE